MTENTKVKLIGGPGHGEVKSIDRGDRYVVFYERQPLPRSVLAGLCDDLASATAQLTPHMYTRRYIRTRINGSDIDEIVYYSPEAMSDFNALRLVLAP